MFKNILVPVDGSAFSTRALKKALVLAKMSGGKVTGFHVAPAYRAEVYADYVPPTFISPREFDKRTREVAEKHLAAVSKAAAAAGVKADCHFISSDFPADAIVKAAVKYRCDLIAMASHGRRGLSKLLLGSETQKVLANTKLPVLVLR